MQFRRDARLTGSVVITVRLVFWGMLPSEIEQKWVWQKFVGDLVSQGRPAMKSPGYGAAGDESPLMGTCSSEQTVSSPIYRALLRSRGIKCPGGPCRGIAPTDFSQAQLKSNELDTGAGRGLFGYNRT